MRESSRTRDKDLRHRLARKGNMTIRLWMEPSERRMKLKIEHTRRDSEQLGWKRITKSYVLSSTI